MNLFPDGVDERDRTGRTRLSSDTVQTTDPFDERGVRKKDIRKMYRVFQGGMAMQNSE